MSISNKFEAGPSDEAEGCPESISSQMGIIKFLITKIPKTRYTILRIQKMETILILITC